MEVIPYEVDPVMLEMELGGLFSEALKIVLGNPDVIIATIAFSTFMTLCLFIVEIYKNFS